MWFYLYAAGIVCIGFAWLVPLGKKETTYQEFDPALWQTFQQMQKEQQQFMNTLEKLKGNFQHQYDALSNRVSQTEKQIEEMVQKQEFDSSDSQDNKEDSLLLHHRYQEIFALKKQGMTTEQIAKQLNIGKGEVELIFQLSDNPGRESV